MTKREFSWVYHNTSTILSCHYVTPKIAKASDFNFS